MMGSIGFWILDTGFYVTYFYPQSDIRNLPWACSSAWLERTPDKREVDGSTPSRPTMPRYRGEIRITNIKMRNMLFLFGF